MSKQPTSINLPQPPSKNEYYTYIPYEKINSTYFPSTFEKDTLCWIFKSKGQQNKKQKVVLPSSKDNNDDDEQKNTSGDGSYNESKKVDAPKEVVSYCTSTRKKELFTRARIVNYVSSSDHSNNNKVDDTNDKEMDKKVKHDGRYLVRYSKGSTYHVRPDNLLPVLEPNSSSIGKAVVPPLVIVTSDTSDYRRMSVIHTCIKDTFLEIGCDFGPCVHRVQHALENVPWVYDSNSKPTSETNTIQSSTEDKKNRKINVLGADKSTESLKIANTSYPNSKFVQCDVLTPKGMSVLFQTCQETYPSRLQTYPTVIAVDINGNRELSTVLLCLQSIMDFIVTQEKEQGRLLPRIIIVKSVLLYQTL